MIKQILRCCVTDQETQITSRNGEDINKSSMPMSSKIHYLPIYPRGINGALPGTELRLENDQRMRKLSYVNTSRCYRLPLHMMRLYGDDMPIHRYRLDAESLHTVLLRTSATQQQQKLKQGPPNSEQPPSSIESAIPPARQTTPLLAAPLPTNLMDAAIRANLENHPPLIAPPTHLMDADIRADLEKHPPLIAAPRSPDPSRSAGRTDLDDCTPSEPAATSVIEPVRRNRRQRCDCQAWTATRFEKVLRICVRVGFVLLVCYFVYCGVQWTSTMVSSVTRYVSGAACSMVVSANSIG